eukprot:TRINITY_DN11464_c0_g1_i6.p1 TRINITY_DN11464_c0_g1~~TRINITY_DN11464_c0_g1_i6.p1  ORF type:complete len:1330 (+),score=368.96 TRINITY_DN11464_c0_g1_i6:137-3991(+)
MGQEAEQGGYDDDHVRRVFERGARVAPDGTAYIDRSEVIPRLQLLGLAPQARKLDELMTQMDTNQDGVIDFPEFLHYFRRTAEDPVTHPGEGEIRQLFELFDEDGNGYLDREEFRKALCDTGDGDGLTDAEIDHLFDQADQMSSGDARGDGRIDVQEFVQFILHREQQTLADSFMVAEVEPDAEEGAAADAPYPVGAAPAGGTVAPQDSAPARRPSAAASASAASAQGSEASPPRQGEAPAQQSTRRPPLPAHAARGSADEGQQGQQLCAEARKALWDWEQAVQKRVMRSRLTPKHARKGAAVLLVPYALRDRERLPYEGKVLERKDDSGVTVQWNPPEQGGPPAELGVPAETLEPLSWWEGEGGAAPAPLRVELPRRRGRRPSAQWDDPAPGAHSCRLEVSGRELVLQMRPRSESDWQRLGPVTRVTLTEPDRVSLHGDFDPQQAVLLGCAAPRSHHARLPSSRPHETLDDLLNVCSQVQAVDHNIPRFVQVNPRQRDVEDMIDWFHNSHVQFLSYKGSGQQRQGQPRPGGAELRRRLSSALGTLTPQGRLAWRAVTVQFLGHVIRSKGEGARSPPRQREQLHISEAEFSFADVRALVCDSFRIAYDNCVLCVDSAQMLLHVAPDTSLQGGGSFVAALSRALGEDCVTAQGPLQVHVYRQPDVVLVGPRDSVTAPTPAEVWVVDEALIRELCRKSDDGPPGMVYFKRRCSKGSQSKLLGDTSCSLGRGSQLGLTPKAGFDDSGREGLVLNVYVAPLRPKGPGGPCVGLAVRVRCGADPRDTGRGEAEQAESAGKGMPFRCGLVLDVSDLGISAARPLALYQQAQVPLPDGSGNWRGWSRRGSPVMMQGAAGAAAASTLCAEFSAEGHYYIADAECSLLVDEMWLDHENTQTYEARGARKQQGGQDYIRPWGCTRKGLKVADRQGRGWACAYCGNEFELWPWMLAPPTKGCTVPWSGPGRPDSRCIERLRSEWAPPGHEAWAWSTDSTSGCLSDVPFATPSLSLAMERAALQLLSLLLGSDSQVLRAKAEEEWQHVPAGPGGEVCRVSVQCRVDFGAVSVHDHPFHNVLPYVDSNFLGRTDLEWRIGDLGRMQPYGICVRRQTPASFSQLRQRLFSLPHFCGAANSKAPVVVRDGQGRWHPAQVTKVQVPPDGSKSEPVTVHALAEGASAASAFSEQDVSADLSAARSEGRPDGGRARAQSVPEESGARALPGDLGEPAAPDEAPAPAPALRASADADRRQSEASRAPRQRPSAAGLQNYTMDATGGSAVRFRTASTPPTPRGT